jgi:hypothetical protein
VSRCLLLVNMWATMTMTTATTTGASARCPRLNHSTTSRDRSLFAPRALHRRRPLTVVASGGEQKTDENDAQKVNPTLTLAPLRGLIATVEDAGGWVHPALRIGHRGGTEAGARGVFAAEEFPRGVVLIVPDALRLTAGAAGGKAALAKALLLRRRQAEVPASTTISVAAAAVASEAPTAAAAASGENQDPSASSASSASRDEDAAEDAFIASLPADGGGLPLLWTAAEVAALEHPALQQAIVRDKEAAHAAWVALGDLHDADDADGADDGDDGDAGGVRGTFVLQEWLRAWATVQSRTFVTTAGSRSDAAGARGEGRGAGKKNKKKKGDRGRAGGGKPSQSARRSGKARTSRKSRIGEESGIDANVETYSMEPLVDLLNHAPFGAAELAAAARGGGGWGEEEGGGGGGAAEDAGRNTLHSYLPPAGLYKLNAVETRSLKAPGFNP